MRYNPFKPGSIIHPGMFAGRIDEIIGIEKLLFQTKNGNSSSFIITGERGIGKSSLLLYLDYIARGNLLAQEGIKFNYIVVSISLEPNDKYEDVIYKIARELERELRNDDKVKAILKGVWDFISNWEVMGVKYSKVKEELGADVMLEELSEKVIKILQNIKTEKDGILFFIDEADKPIKNPNLGILTKYLTERIQKKGISNFAIGIIGLPVIMEKLKESHESSLRIFTPFYLRLLNKDECDLVIQLGLNEAKLKNGIDIGITDGARSIISSFSEGYPHFLQQYCYSSFEVDKDNNIDEKDVRDGLSGENGALKQLGDKYFDRMYYKEISSKNYRKILIVMAKSDLEYIGKQEIISSSGLSEGVVTNAINAFCKKGIIIREKGKKGQYKISSRSFKAWIIAFSTVTKE